MTEGLNYFKKLHQGTEICSTFLRMRICSYLVLKFTHILPRVAIIILDYMYYADIVTSIKLNACLFRITTIFQNTIKYFN